MDTRAPPQPGVTALAPGLARKVKKVLEVKVEAPDLVQALETLSQLYHENTPATRRALRSAVERRGLGISETFIEAAEAVIQALDGVSSNLDALSSSCSKIFSTLSTTKAATLQLSSETERLQGEAEAVDVKMKTVTDFLSQYQVSEEEVRALQTEDASEAFFAALAHVRQIHDNCRGLLRTQHQRAGLELMELMATYQETAYERLCRWIQGECRNMGDLDAPDVSSNLQAAVHALRDRPVLFKYCIEEVATARHNALFQRFIAALTRGGPGGMPRPIEMHAHDPKRYCNDMLAWVHQALADEREFVAALFGSEAAGDSYGAEAGFGGGDVGHHNGDMLSASALLDRIFDSICRPLRVRIEQVLMSTLPPLTYFQLAQLHSFYLQLLARVLGPSAQLVQAVRACRDMAHRVFMEQMRTKADKLVRNPPQPPKDLSAPPQVSEAVHTMLEVIDAHESAMQAGGGAPSQSDGSAADQSDGELQPVMAMLVDSLMDACNRSAESLQADAPSRVGGSASLSRSARAIYLLNCLSSAAAACGPRRCAAAWAAQLNAAAEQHANTLVECEVKAVLVKVGSADILERLQLYQQQHATHSSPQPVQPSATDTSAAQSVPASDPSLAYERVVDAMRSFFALLSSPDALPEFESLQVAKVRSQVSTQFACSLAAAYEALYQAVDDPRNGYQAAGGVAGIRHTPQQVRTILGIS